jgi:hypothetical protein
MDQVVHITINTVAAAYSRIRSSITAQAPLPTDKNTKFNQGCKCKLVAMAPQNIRAVQNHLNLDKFSFIIPLMLSSMIH